MSELKVGVEAPQFCLPDKDNNEVCLKDFKGKYVVLYFYPKDNSPGCTTEAIGFTGILPDLQKLDAFVIGVSPDSPESHAKFIEKKRSEVGLPPLQITGVEDLRKILAHNKLNDSQQKKEEK